MKLVISQQIIQQNEIVELLEHPLKLIELSDVQITYLTEKITTVEEQMSEIIVVIDKLSKLVDYWNQERQLLKKLIVIDEDIILFRSSISKLAGT